MSTTASIALRWRDRLIHWSSLLVNGAIALAAFVAGMALAGQHPVWPVWVVSAVFGWAVATAYFPVAWQFVVVACLPWLNFSPWTGWRVADEFDLLILATVAGAYGRRVWEQWFAPNTRPIGSQARSLGLTTSALAIALVVLTTGISAWRGWVAWPMPAESVWNPVGSWMFQDEHSRMSSLRLAKSLLWPMLLWPLWRQQVQADGGPGPLYRRFAWGMCAGLAVVALVAWWERAAFPGWFNFSTHYRTTATFWEMHFGGAAIDIYLVASAPFAIWFLVSQRRPWPWLAAAMLAVLALYAVLTTFSRGVYAAVLLPLAVLLAAHWIARHRAWWSALVQPLGQLRWRGPAGVVLALVLMSELLLVTVGGTYMRERLAESEVDLAQRMAHWQRSLALRQTSADHLWGIGLGRLPWRYANQGEPKGPEMTPNRIPTEFAGRAQVLHDAPSAGMPASSTRSDSPTRSPASSTTDSSTDSPTAFLRLSGPSASPELGGLFSINQQLGKIQLHNLSRPRVTTGTGLADGQSHRPNRPNAPNRQKDVWPLAELQLRSSAPSQLLIKLCEKHLIYEGNCYIQAVTIAPGGGSSTAAPASWQTMRVALLPYQNLPLEGFWQRSSSLSLSVLTAGQSVDVRSVQLSASGVPVALNNANFKAGMAYWLPGAGSYYLPWHIDNLYLELLIERGWLGAAAIGLLLLVATRALIRACRFAPIDAASGQNASSQQPVVSPVVSVAPYLAASILGCCLAGLVSSVLDAPRIATLFLSLLLMALLANSGDKKPQT